MKNFYRKQKKYTRGLTLIETLLYLALFSVLILAALPLLIELNTWHSKESSLADSMASFLFVDGKIRSLAQDATGVIEPMPGQSSDHLVLETLHGDRYEVPLASLISTTTHLTNVNFYQPSGSDFTIFSFTTDINGFRFGTSTYVIEHE